MREGSGLAGKSNPPWDRNARAISLRNLRQSAPLSCHPSGNSQEEEQSEGGTGNLRITLICSLSFWKVITVSFVKFNQEKMPLDGGPGSHWETSPLCVVGGWEEGAGADLTACFLLSPALILRDARQGRGRRGEQAPP